MASRLERVLVAGRKRQPGVVDPELAKHPSVAVALGYFRLLLKILLAIRRMVELLVIARVP
jgi:hypothetical protein